MPLKDNTNCVSRDHTFRRDAPPGRLYDDTSKMIFFKAIGIISFLDFSGFG